QNSTLEGKENQKTIYTQWVADLEKQLLFTKDEVAKTTDVEYKKVLEEKIQSIDKQLQEKKQLVATTTEEIQQIKQRETVAVVQETVVPVTTTPTTSVETIKLDSTIKSAAIEAPSVIATTIAASTSANSINTETTTVAITNTVAVSATTNTVSESAVAVNSPVVSTTTVSPVTTATVAEVPPVKMTKEEAQNQSKQFAQESAKLQQKANAARAKANAETDPAKRDSLFEVVIAIEKQAKQKQDESAKSVAQENKIEFDKNRIYLDQYVQLAANNSSTEASMASMFADEALIYFSEAEKERKQAAISTNYSTRNGALQKAAENERIAIEKQNKALESYKLLYSDFKPTETPQKVLAAPVVTPSVAAVTTPSTSVASSSAVEAKADSVPTKEVTTSIQASNTNTEVVVEQVKKDTALAVSTPTVAISTQPIQTLTTTSAAVAVVETPSVAAVKQEALASEVSAEMAVDSISQLPKLTSEQITQVKETREFKNFVILSNETEIAMREANAENKKAETLRFKAEEQSAWYYEYKAKATSATGSEKKEFEAKRDSAEALLAKYTQEADSVFKLAKNSEASANAKKVETELFLQSINSGNQVNVLAAANKSGVNVKPYLSKLPAVTTTSSSAVATATTSASTQQVDNKQEGITVAQTQTNPNQTTPKVLVPVKKTEVFERKTTPVYSKSKPIPINEKLPDGLLFKVQIGAFKNPIPQNLFKGITPITGETTPQGYIRYTAGIFTLFESANKTKDIIKSYGYKDAFVVAFLNGQRIPLSQALSMIGGSTATTINSSVAGNTPIQQVVNTVTPSSSTSTQNVEVSNIKDVKGLMYTVQVGVYSRQVSLDKLYGLSPVYTENMTNGLFRYTSGIYNRSKLANDAKSKIVNMGIKDAFVVAFLNSKRISLPEAQKLEQTEGDKVFATSTNMNQMPAAATNTSSSQNTVTQSNTTQPVNASTLPSGIQDLDDTKQKVYAIQIGAFKNEVPIEMANSFIKLASRKGNIKNFVDENGMTVYSIGGFTDYDQAAKFKQEIVTQEGIKDAFLIATQNGKKVPVK
ncbi:MAG: SPOR domain-containing protein, partial [Bacteroidetes bacterium]|nr:SPOR domain-containing protein [Bacteroidota bacterium]